jgi:hypothetical protein
MELAATRRTFFFADTATLRNGLEGRALLCRAATPVPPVPDAALFSPRPGVLPKPGRGGDLVRSRKMPTRSGDQVVETATEARQGVTGHNVRYVLLFGTVGAFVALFAAYFAFFA